MNVVSGTRCRGAGAVIAARVADGRPLPAPVRRHRDACLRCAAAESRARVVARELRALAGRTEPVPADLEYRVMTTIGEPVVPEPSRRLEPVAGIAAGVAAAVALVLVLARRRAVPQV